MVFYKKLMVGAMCAAVATLAECEDTFHKELDRVFLDHAQEIGERIKAWNDFNSNKPDYIITEKELKDVVLRAREEAVRYMQLCLEHQVAFFDYFKAHRRKGCTEFLKKQFDAEQIRIRALRDLENMIEKFESKGVNCKPLVRYKELCNSYKPEPNNPDGLYRGLIDTWGIESHLGDLCILAGNHEIWEKTAQDRYVSKRVRNFFDRTLLRFPWEPHWTNMSDFDEIVHIFHRGYALYTKCNVSQEKWNYGHGAPEYCLFNPYDESGICDDIFACDDLTVAYCTTRESVRKYIRLACTLCILLEKFFGAKQSIERIENFMLANFVNLNCLRNNIVDELEGHAAFKTIADALKGGIRLYKSIVPRKHAEVRGVVVRNGNGSAHTETPAKRVFFYGRIFKKSPIG